MGKTMFMLVYVILGVICLYHANLLACVVWIFCGVWASVLHTVLRALTKLKILEDIQKLSSVLNDVTKELDKNEQARPD